MCSPARAAPGPGRIAPTTLVALALRLPDIGNPLVDLDEQMYLLVGQRMWDGAIPYVDIWDRKPIGLFLIYAASAALPIDAIVAVHDFPPAADGTFALPSGV